MRSVRSLPVANPQNRFLPTTIQWDDGEGELAGLKVFEERSKTILNEVDSPDVGMKWSVNPYRGCFHACAYCYARPTHQYWGFGAGTDFDRNIVARVNAPELLRAAFEKKSWQGESITFSGNTGCYQPLEGKFKLTRRLLEVCAEYRNPVHVITKSALIRRDVDLLGRLVKEARVGVTLSIPFADEDMARAIEPFASATSARFDTLRILTDAGVETSMNIAPVIPGLNDDGIPELLERGVAAGITRAAVLPVRLAAEVLPVFIERLAAAYPQRLSKVQSALRQIRNGKLNESEFGARMTGEGPRWEAIRMLFDVHCKRLGLDRGERDDGSDAAKEIAPTTFRRPRAQQSLFGDSERD
jgi:DNA repair photolyase